MNQSNSWTNLYGARLDGPVKLIDPSVRHTQGQALARGDAEAERGGAAAGGAGGPSTGLGGAVWRRTRAPTQLVSGLKARSDTSHSIPARHRFATYDTFGRTWTTSGDFDPLRAITLINIFSNELKGIYENLIAR
jgi:hypothetical protein